MALLPASKVGLNGGLSKEAKANVAQTLHYDPNLSVTEIGEDMEISK